MSGPGLPPEDAGPGAMEPPPDDVLAGEFVLGVLNAAERRSAQVRANSDPAFAQRVVDWERRFVPWLNDIQPVEAPAQAWAKICLRLGWQDGEPASLSLWRNLAFWRAAAVSSLLLAVAILWTAQWTRTPPPPPVVTSQPPTGEAAETRARLVTPLAHDDGTPGWLASVDRSRGTVLMVPVPASPDPQGRVPELWLIPAGQAPRSLGLGPGVVRWMRALPVTSPRAMRKSSPSRARRCDTLAA